VAFVSGYNESGLASKRRFGVSTHLYHGRRLCREHLLEIGAHGFETVDLFATRSHFDYHNPAAVGDLQQWLAEAGLELHAIHAPVGARYDGGRWSEPLSIASVDPAQRARAVGEAERALHIARRIPAAVLIVHVGLSRLQPQTPGGDNRAAARRSVEQLVAAAQPLGVATALEVIPNELSRTGSLVHFVEHDLEELKVGVCLDFWHAHIDGDLVDAIETASEHLIAAEVHDNRGRTDEHLIPLEGTIDWPSALTAVQKIGYEGPLTLEIGGHGSTKDLLARARKARERMERMLAT
jgi:sugar phosphate isomerase/epimerase